MSQQPESPGPEGVVDPGDPGDLGDVGEAAERSRDETRKLVELLDIERLDLDLFRGRQPETTRQRVYGGQVAAQALLAADHTVDGDYAVHSLHSYFLRPGDAGVPISLEVERVRDGRAFSHRRVRAVQHGRAIVEASLSFAVPEEGVSHQVAPPAAPAPGSVPSDIDVLASLPGFTSRYGTSADAFELRTVGLGADWFTTATPPEEPTLVWMRADGEVPDDPVVHAALLTYASDLRIMHPMLRPHARSMYGTDVRPATVDHTVWFHSPARVDDWLLWRMDSPWAGHGRGLCRAAVHAPDGGLLASAAQEGLVRLT